MALTRAGVPLERGLLGLGSDLPGKLGRIATTLGERMSRGESLAQALEASGDGLPRAYRAVVEAGLRSGRLSTALEGLSVFARGYSEARRSIGLALWYPLLVLFVAYVLLLFIVNAVVPRFLGAFRSMGLPSHAFLGVLDAAGRYVWYWAPVVPALFALFLAVWVGSRRSFWLGGGRRYGFLRWFPWMGSMMSAYEAAGFADLLALLVEHRVPYPDALVLAGEASGDPAMARSGRELAAAVGKGLPPAEAMKGRGVFPPMLRWLLATGPRQDDLVSALRHAGERYRVRARFQAEKIRIFLPTILLFGIGATATLFYALTLFLPLTTLWTDLALPVR